MIGPRLVHLSHGNIVGGGIFHDFELARTSIKQPLWQPAQYLGIRQHEHQPTRRIPKEGNLLPGQPQIHARAGNRHVGLIHCQRTAHRRSYHQPMGKYAHRMRMNQTGTVAFPMMTTATPSAAIRKEMMTINQRMDRRTWHSDQ